MKKKERKKKVVRDEKNGQSCKKKINKIKGRRERKAFHFVLNFFC